MIIPDPPKDGKFRILLIEDDPAIARLITKCLTSVGYDCLDMPDGTRGLQSFRNFDPHLVLLDLMMPIVGGEQVGLKIRETSAVPIIVLTAKAIEEAERQVFKMGADDYIIKPFGLKSLQERIAIHLGRAYHCDGVEEDGGEAASI